MILFLSEMIDFLIRIIWLLDGIQAGVRAISPKKPHAALAVHWIAVVNTNPTQLQTLDSFDSRQMFCPWTNEPYTKYLNTPLLFLIPCETVVDVSLFAHLDLSFVT